MSKTRLNEKKLFIADFIDPTDGEKKWVTFISNEGCDRIKAAIRAVRTLYGGTIIEKDILIVSIIRNEKDYKDGHEYSIIPVK